jgi:hypothetical protein
VPATVELEAVPQKLGLLPPKREHASIEMTQRYAHLAPDYLGREVARLSFALPTDGKVLPLHTARQVP